MFWKRGDKIPDGVGMVMQVLERAGLDSLGGFGCFLVDQLPDRGGSVGNRGCRRLVLVMRPRISREIARQRKGEAKGNHQKE